MLALSQDLEQNRPVEAREHVRRFHELFFTLSPDKSAIEGNIQRAMFLLSLIHIFKNDLGSQLALMEAKPRHNTVDVPTLFWAAIPGNAGDFPSEESFHTFIEQALCLFIGEPSYKNSLSPFGIRMEMCIRDR